MRDYHGSNNPFYGKHHSKESRIQMRIKRAFRVGNKSPSWKQHPTYKSLHVYMRKHIPKPDLCKRCNIDPPREIACITRIYDRNPINWEWMCARCHMYFDNRHLNLVQFRKNIEPNQPK